MAICHGNPYCLLKITIRFCCKEYSWYRNKFSSMNCLQQYVCFLFKKIRWTLQVKVSGLGCVCTLWINKATERGSYICTNEVDEIPTNCQSYCAERFVKWSHFLRWLTFSKIIIWQRESEWSSWLLTGFSIPSWRPGFDSRLKKP